MKYDIIARRSRLITRTLESFFEMKYDIYGKKIGDTIKMIRIVL